MPLSSIFRKGSKKNQSKKTDQTNAEQTSNPPSDNKPEKGRNSDEKVISEEVVIGTDSATEDQVESSKESSGTAYCENENLEYGLVAKKALISDTPTEEQKATEDSFNVNENFFDSTSQASEKGSSEKPINGGTYHEETKHDLQSQLSITIKDDTDPKIDYSSEAEESNDTEDTNNESQVRNVKTDEGTIADETEVHSVQKITSEIKEECSEPVRSIDADEQNNDKNDVNNVSSTIRRLSDFVEETVREEVWKASLSESLPLDMSEAIRKLSSFIDETIKVEIQNLAKLNNESGQINPSSAEKHEAKPDAPKSPDSQNIYVELPIIKNCPLETLHEESPDTKSEEDLLLDDNHMKIPTEVPRNIDILTPSINLEQCSEDSCGIPKNNSSNSIETLDAVSTTGSMYSEQDDQGIYLPMPDFTQQATSTNPNWKVGYLQVKLPHKSRGRGKLKVWQKKMVVIQADEFFEDQKNRSLILSIYQSDSTSSRRHSAAFWKSVCSKSAVIYRSTSRTHPYAFTVADDCGPIVHLAAVSETETQEWIAAIRNILWPPSSVMQLEKVLNGNEFEVSVIDNDFAYRAGLLGSYGYLAVTGRKLILCHPQSGHVIQEWYLNTVDKFQLLPMPKEVDTNKVLIMHTSSDSSTGCGEIKFFCNEAVAFLQSLASTIHQVLQHHNKDRKGCYEKELEEIAQWLTPPQQPENKSNLPIPEQEEEEEEHYKVPRRQVRSLLDIPNFIFDKSLYMTNQNGSPPHQSSSLTSKLNTSTTCISTFSEDSGISIAASSDDFLNCSHTSFTIGNRSLRRQDRTSSGSDLSDAYTPPITPDLKRKIQASSDKPQESITAIKPEES